MFIAHEISTIAQNLAGRSCLGASIFVSLLKFRLNMMASKLRGLVRCLPQGKVAAVGPVDAVCRNLSQGSEV